MRVCVMIAKRTVESDHGIVDADVLADLKLSSIPSELYAAIGMLDETEGRQRWLHACLVRLHAMTKHLIDGTPKTVTGSEPIWQLAEEIADELDAHTADLARISKIVDRLGRLRPNGYPPPQSST